MSTPSEDVLIIGGGIIGLACADRLAADGRRVRVLERQRCGQEASWAGAGILAPCSWHRQDDLARMHMDALRCYPDYAAALQERSGIDPGYRRCGKLRLILDANRMNMAVKEARVAAAQRTPDGAAVLATLDPTAVRTLEPQLAGALLGAQHCRMTAQVRNPRLLQALAAACRRRGVVIEEGSIVRGLVKDGDRVRGARVDQGQRLAGTTLLCAGSWSSGLDAALGDCMPMHPVRGQMLLLHLAAAPLQGILEIEERHFYVVPRDDGHILIGSTEEHDSGFRKRNTAEAVARLAEQALRWVPALAGATLVRCWAGLRPGTPDRRPFMGRVPGLEDLWAVTGHFRTGLTVAPVVADIAADWLSSGRCAYDLRKAAPGRQFPAGSRL